MVRQKNMFNRIEKTKIGMIYKKELIKLEIRILGYKIFLLKDKFHI